MRVSEGPCTDALMFWFSVAFTFVFLIESAPNPKPFTLNPRPSESGVYLSIYPSISIYLSTYIYPSISIYLYLSIYQYAYIYIYLSFYLSICIYIYIYVYIYICRTLTVEQMRREDDRAGPAVVLPRPHVYLYLSIYIYLSIDSYLSIYISIYPSMSIYLSIYLSIYMSIYL